MQVHEGILSARGMKLAIVVSRFNSLVTGELLAGALDRLRRLGAEEGDLLLARVPGAFELPRAVRTVSARVEGVLALGAVVRGATPHFDYVAAEVSKGLAQLSMELPVPVAFGVITADTQDQALERAGGKGGNRGAQAAESLVEMVNLERGLRG